MDEMKLASPLLRVLLWPTVLTVLFVVFSKHVAKYPALRKRITKNPLWKTQLALHPLIVFILLDQAAQSRSVLFAVLLVPFAFNFGVEPFDIPADPIFLGFFYLHHYAVIWAAGVLLALNQVNEFGRAQALLMGHAWTLHTIGFASHKGSTNKNPSGHTWL